jgi:hypothetical protein
MHGWGGDKMKSTISTFLTASQSASYFLGGAVIVLASLLAIWSIDPEAALDWTLRTLGPGFVAALTALTLGVFYCLIRLVQSKDEAAEAEFWLGAGVQLSNGVATLALTFTLFGISVGIGALASQGLTPETVGSVIRELTGSFTLAFMTTVIGLPLSTALRASLVIIYGRQRLAAEQSNILATSNGGRSHEVSNI